MKKFNTAEVNNSKNYQRNHENARGHKKMWEKMKGEK